MSSFAKTTGLLCLLGATALTASCGIEDASDPEAPRAADSGAAGSAGKAATDGASQAGSAAAGSGGHASAAAHDHGSGSADAAGAPASQPAAAPGHSSSTGSGAGASAAAFNITLTTAEEVPRCDAASTRAQAIGSAAIAADGQSISIVLAHAELSGAPVMGHIHFGKLGAAGPVVFDLGPDLESPIRKVLRAADYKAPMGAPADFDAFLVEMRNGNSYLNIHTDSCKTGEIRGQIDNVDPAEKEAGAEPSAFHAKLSKNDEVPLCAAAGKWAVGESKLAIAADGSKIALRVSHYGLSGAPTMAHVHFGEPGVAGPILLNIVPNATLIFSASDYTAPMNGPKDFPALVQAIEDGKTYFNIHTMACPTGELRGQIRDAAEKWTDAPSEFQTRLTPEEEVPLCDDAAQDAIAIGALVIGPDEKQVAISLAHNGLSSDPTLAHIHFGERGAAGPVVLDLGPDLKSPIRKTLSAADYKAPDGAPADFAGLIDAIRAGKTYFNLHTDKCKTGEARGQIEP